MNQPNLANQQEQYAPQPAQTFIPSVCKVLVDAWVESRLLEAKHLTTLIAHKRLQVTKLVNHSAEGTFPTNISCSEPFNQFPLTIDRAIVATANEEELQAGLTFKRTILRIRTRELAQDLKVHEDRLKALLNFDTIMQQAAGQLAAIPKTRAVLEEVANTIMVQYELQQYRSKELLAKKTPAAVTPVEMMVDAAGGLDGNRIASLQRTQDVMLKKINSLESQLKQRKNLSGRGSGGTPQGKPNHEEARERSASRGRSKQRSFTQPKNRDKSNASNKSDKSNKPKSSSKGKGRKEQQEKGSQGKGHSSGQAAKGRSKR